MRLDCWLILHVFSAFKIIIVVICYITILYLLLGITIYLYCKYRYLLEIIKNAKEIDNNKQTFVASVVHDLKTPTNAQINSLNLLKNEAFGKLNSQQREIISLTQESCKYMSNLIGTIMDTYQNDFGDVPLDITSFDIIKLIDDVCTKTKILSDNKRQTIAFEHNIGSIIVNADKLQIERVILNLVSNAITYGYNCTKIEIKAFHSDTRFEFCVINKSKQISPQELSTIFEKFKKSKYACYNRAGNGLGLYLSKQIINRHNGKVYAKSTKDGICTFGFSIPIKQKPKKKKCRINT